jgi:hypothetical protein
MKSSSYIGVGQNNGDTTDTVHISLLIWCWTTFSTSTATSFSEWTLTSFEQTVMEFYTILLEEYLQVALEILEVGICFSSLQNWKECLNDVQCDDYAGQGRCWFSPSCSSNRDWTVPAVWIEALSSWTTASFFGNNVWILGCIWLLNLSMYPLAVIRLWRVIMGQTGFHDIATQTITEPPPCFTLVSRHSGL